MNFTSNITSGLHDSIVVGNIFTSPSAEEAFDVFARLFALRATIRAFAELVGDPERLRTRKLRRTLGEVPFR